jgi:hypothetical protein
LDPTFLAGRIIIISEARFKNEPLKKIRIKLISDCRFDFALDKKTLNNIYFFRKNFSDVYLWFKFKHTFWGQSLKKIL